MTGLHDGSRAVGDRLHARGLSALNRGRHAQARRLFARALEVGGDGDSLARVEASMAYLLSETGEGDRALELCRAALRRPGLSTVTRGALHGQSGLVLMLRGDTVRAAPEFDRAVELLTDPRELARVHLNRGNIHLQRHELTPARDDFQTAGRLYAEGGDTYDCAKATHNLGYAHLLAGDLITALTTLGLAHDVLAAGSPAMLATVEQDRAEALVAAGLIREGVEALRAASTAFGRRRLYQRQGEADLALARYEPNPHDARAASRRAADRFRRSGADSWLARARAAEFSCDVRLGRTGDVEARGDALVAVLTAHRLRWHSTSVRLLVVRALLDRGDLAPARERLRRIRSDAGAPLPVRLTEREVRATAAQAARRSRDAHRHVRAGLADLHSWQSSFGSLDLQTNVVGQGVRLGVRGLELAVQSRAHAVLFEWSERARMLASRVQPVRAPQDPDTVADLAALRSELAPAREAELRQRIRERAWQQRGSGEVTDPIRLAELRAELGDDTALVAYVVTADRVVGLVVTDRGTRRHELGDRAVLDRLLGGLLADLDMAAADLPAPLAGSVRAALAGRLAAIAELLVAPLLRDLGDRRVVLTPSGVLAGVPWTLLPGLAGRPVTVAQSATSWVMRRATPLRTATAGFVAGPRVSRAEAEVRAAAKEWGGAPTLTGPEAKATAVSELAGRVDVLHVAAHGRHSAENPLFSGLELVDGTWFGYDIDQLTAVPDVVLLSSCEVGRSSVRWGEELIGMTAAWLHAGARCVLASPAAVNDEAAYEALVGVHAGLAAGLDPAAALARALADAVAASPRPPAPFVCFG